MLKIGYLVLLATAAGCGLTQPQPVVCFLPAISVVAGSVCCSTAPAPDSDVCDNCNGMGWLGDGTIRNDCPDCETPWVTLDLPALAEKILQETIELADQAEALVRDLTPSTPEPDSAALPAIESLQEADEQPSRLLITYYHSASCGPCRKLEQLTLTDPLVKSYLTQHYGFAQVTDPTVMALDGVASTPQLRVGDQTLRGFHGPTETLRWLANQVAKATPPPSRKD